MEVGGVVRSWCSKPSWSQISWAKVVIDNNKNRIITNKADIPTFYGDLMEWQTFSIILTHLH